jgi:subfamily B ATP-binding cassette protein MsbA
MTENNRESVSRSEKIEALLSAVRYRPRLTVLLVVLGVVIAVLEAVGVTFILPIIEIIQVDNPVAEADGLMLAFVRVYQTFGIPFTLEFAILGVATVMTLRYTGSFIYGWFTGTLQFTYQRYLRKRAFDLALEVEMDYLDEEGSDQILNKIVTESRYAAEVIMRIVKILKLFFLILAYLLVALWISPLMTAISVVVLGSIGFLIRRVFESGYDLGELVAEANERQHEAAQAGLFGIRDIRIFSLKTEIYEKFVDAVDQHTVNSIKQNRNQTGINRFNNLAIAVFVFVLIYLALRLADLSFGELGVFLFAMFQLGPKVSSLNQRWYSFETQLPHLVWTQQLLNELDQRQEQSSGSRSVPSDVETVEFEDVSFSYNDEEQVLNDVSFAVNKGEFVAFVGQSGAGKSTIVSLLARYYEPDRGQIYADGAPIDEMDPREWRDRLAIVRQSPYIFNDTLRYNLTVGNRTATQQEIDQACEIARVDEFMDELPKGYDSQLGDEGVRLSGGQKQRLALARALLKDADLLILDEATSDLDTNLEQEVQQAIEEMDRDYGIITIAHRLSTVENADRIYTMESGRISEQGDHSELVNKNGKYAELYAVQVG